MHNFVITITYLHKIIWYEHVCKNFVLPLVNRLDRIIYCNIELESVHIVYSASALSLWWQEIQRTHTRSNVRYNSQNITGGSFERGRLMVALTCTVYPKKYAHGFCFAVLCCGYTLTGFPISIKLTSLALWQSNDCPSASKATLMNIDKYFMWIHYERLHNRNKAKHNKTVCIFLGIYCM